MTSVTKASDRIERTTMKRGNESYICDLQKSNVERLITNENYAFEQHRLRVLYRK